MKYKNMHIATIVTGIQLRKLREASGMSASTLGKKIDKHHNVILSIEAGQTDPSIMLLSQILVALGLELHEFFDSDYDYLFNKAVKGELENEQVTV